MNPTVITSLLLALVVHIGIGVILGRRVSSVADLFPLVSRRQARVDKPSEFSASTVATTISLATVVMALFELAGLVTPRVTAEELAKWESLHENRISHIIGIVRRPEIILDVGTFDYSYLWEQSFQKMLIIYRDKPVPSAEPIHEKIAERLRAKFESERVRYERELETFQQILNEKLKIKFGTHKQSDIDDILLYRGVSMNNLWLYIMVNGYAVPFIDNATVSSDTKDIYGTSLAYEETCQQLVNIRKLCSDLGFIF